MFDSTAVAIAFVKVLPGLIVPTAWGVVIIWRQWRLEQHVDGQMNEMKGLLVEKGKYEGFKEAIPLAREDRREFAEALLTPPPVQPVKPPPAPPDKEDPK